MANSRKDISSMVTVVDFDLDPAEKDWSYDINSILIVKQVTNTDLDSNLHYVIQIDKDINGTITYGYPEYYDIYCRITPGYPSSKEIECKISVPKNLNI